MGNEKFQSGRSQVTGGTREGDPNHERDPNLPLSILQPSWVREMGAGNEKDQSDRSQIIGRKLLIGQLAPTPWITSPGIFNICNFLLMW